MATPMDNNLAFANRRDEAVHRIQEQMKQYIQQTEVLHKELATVDKQRDELVATIDVLQAAVGGLQRALNTVNGKEPPAELEEYIGRAGRASMATRGAGDW